MTREFPWNADDIKTIPANAETGSASGLRETKR